MKSDVQSILGKIDKLIYGSKSFDDLVGAYKTWSSEYDSDMEIIDYVAPGMVCNALKKWNADPNHKVLDVGCGTGIVAEELKKLGFKNIDGADVSQDMLDLAHQKNIYDNLFCFDVTNRLLM